MVSAINGSQAIDFSVFGSVSAATKTAAPATTSAYSSDNFSKSSFTAASSEEDNKKAGFFKRFGNFFGRTFDTMKDWAGLGTISHFAKQNLELYDLDKSNSLNTTEFGAVSAMVSSSFEEIDKNANGELSLGEFKKVVGDILETTFDNMDTNSDGFLNYNEAATGGYVVTNGSQDSFRRNDTNEDNLLSFAEFAHLANEIKKMK